MKEAINITPIRIGQLGQYVHIKCSRCGKSNGNWTFTKITFADCDCTIRINGSKWRTVAKVDLLTNEK